MFNISRQFYVQNRATTLTYLLSSRIHGASRPEPLLVADSPTVAQKARTQRGGQDLTNRHIRLSTSVRRKQAFSRDGTPERRAVDPFLTRNEPIAQGNAVAHGPSSFQSTKTFRGIVIPEKPKPPEPDECCMSGCAICVYDLYLTSLESYGESVSAIRSTLQSQNVPASQWPGEIGGNEGERDGSIGKDPLSELDVSIVAFAQLERSIRETQKSP